MTKEDTIVTMLRNLRKVDAPPYFEADVLRRIRRSAAVTSEEPVGFFSRFAMLFPASGLTIATLIVVVVLNSSAYRMETPSITFNDVQNQTLALNTPMAEEEILADIPSPATEGTASLDDTERKPVTRERRDAIDEPSSEVTMPPPALSPDGAVNEAESGSGITAFPRSTNFRGYAPVMQEKASVDSLREKLFSRDTVSTK